MKITAKINASQIKKKKWRISMKLKSGVLKRLIKWTDL